MQSQGGWITSADGCPGDCRLGETRVHSSLSLHQAAQALPSSCDMVFSGHTTPLFNPPGNIDQSVLSQMESRQEYFMGDNISWGIQAGLVCRLNRQEQRLILVNAWFFSTLTTNVSLSVSYSTSE